MAETTVGDVIDPQRDSSRVHAERSRPIADVPDVSGERFAGKAWVSGDLDTQSFEDAAVAIEHLCQVCFTERQVAEAKCLAARDATGATAPCCRARRQSGPSHLIDPSAFDW